MKVPPSLIKNNTMKIIMEMLSLGLIAGMVAGLWTRVIKPNMILGRVGKWLTKKNNTSVIMTTKNNPWVQFVKCLFCMPLWLCLLFDLWYIVTFLPPFTTAVIGILGSMGTSNLVSEVVHALRNEG